MCNGNRYQYSPELPRAAPSSILVRMTRFRKPKTVAKARRGYWMLQDAKARFSELVRKVRSEGPQHVTVHGRDEVVIIAAEEFRRLQGNATGEVLIKAIQESPWRDTDLEPARQSMPVRNLSL